MILSNIQYLLCFSKSSFLLTSSNVKTIAISCSYVIKGEPIKHFKKAFSEELYEKNLIYIFLNDPIEVQNSSYFGQIHV